LERRQAMAKKESTFLNMIVTLLIVTFVASSALGYIYELTKAPRAEAMRIKQTFAIKKVLPEFDNDPLADQYVLPANDGSGELSVYPALAGGDSIGAAVKTFSNNGYGGIIELMVGFNKSGEIIDIAVVNQKETPGLGTKMADDSYIKQYRGLNPGETDISVKQDGGEIDAITAATISSRAFSEAVQKGYNTYLKGETK